MKQSLIGLVAGAVVMWIYAKQEDGKWYLILLTVFIALVYAGSLTEGEVRLTEKLCPEPTEFCDRAKTGVLLLFASVATLFGGGIGAGGVYLLLVQQQRRGG